MTARMLSLFSGYGGLDMAVEQVLGAETIAVADIDKGARKILAHRYPDVPNIGDVSTVDYRTLGRVDVIAGGFPCQDVSSAGRRAGLRDGTRSGLWSEMHRAIKELRPRWVVAENVRGILSAEADSDVEPCPWCVGDEPAGHMRALGAVLADLADLGYDARWCGLRAADVGAPHERFRVFILAYPADADSRRHGGLWQPATGEATGGGADSTSARRDRAPVALLPTPVVNDVGDGRTVDWWDDWMVRMRGRHGNNGHGASLAIEAARLLPTPTTTQRGTDARLDERDGARANLHNVIVDLLPPPTATDAKASGAHGYGGQTQCTLTDAAVRRPDQWGQYAAAIERWEHITGRPAPDPTEPTGKGGRHRLSPRLPEWMMGLPDGWITDVPGVSRAEAIKAAGNGVVPQQAEAALRYLLGAS